MSIARCDLTKLDVHKNTTQQSRVRLVIQRDLQQNVYKLILLSAISRSHTACTIIWHGDARCIVGMVSTIFDMFQSVSIDMRVTW